MIQVDENILKLAIVNVLPYDLEHFNYVADNLESNIEELPTAFLQDMHTTLSHTLPDLMVTYERWEKATESIERELSTRAFELSGVER